MGRPAGFGPLVSDPLGRFDLPAGFTYQIISQIGDPMDDGLRVPGRPDGMATFPGPGGRTIIIRNHELTPSGGIASPFGNSNENIGLIPASKFYDIRDGVTPCIGATTTLLYNTQSGTLEGQWLSLVGTQRNCAGGLTPWGSWLSCEENVTLTGGGFLEDHGFVFEVPATSTPQIADPIALTAMGRFNHEAAAVDPASGVIYMTEDVTDSLIYRFLPDVPGDLAAGGQLQALVVQGKPSLDTRNFSGPQTVVTGDVQAVQWIDLTNVLSPLNDLRAQGFAAGAARFARGEGMWYDDGVVFFACTSGGNSGDGQIWKYVPSPDEGLAAEASQPATLELFIEPNNSSILNRADNITAAPWGDLILCEDGFGMDYMVGVTPAGDTYQFARNAISSSELAGGTFSPDGTTLFVNIQESGWTLAITGPFPTPPMSSSAAGAWIQYE